MLDEVVLVIEALDDEEVEDEELVVDEVTDEEDDVDIEELDIVDVEEETLVGVVVVDVEVDVETVELVRESATATPPTIIITMTITTIPTIATREIAFLKLRLLRIISREIIASYLMIFRDFEHVILETNFERSIPGQRLPSASGRDRVIGRD